NNAPLSSITDNLPAGFSYVAGSSSVNTGESDVAIGDPSQSGEGSTTLTWDTPMTVPASGSGTLHFLVTASSTTGSYTNSAAAAAVHLSSVQTTKTSVEIEGLTNGDTYHFTVQATNCAGTGPESAPSESVTPAAGTSAQVIGPGNFVQTTGTGNNPTPGDTTI